MKKLILIAFIAAMVGVFASAPLAQAPTRITFRHGATSAVVTGSLRSYRSSRKFVIRVRAGQRLTTERISGGAISIWVRDPSGEEAGDLDASCHSSREVNPTVAGDYKLEVVECQKADAWRGNFKFRIRVR
jgi:hypothetical protein